MNWIYNDSILESIPEGAHGFIYLITYEDGTKYIGKKVFYNQRRLKPRKNDRKNAKRIAIKESNWKNYTGSTKLSEGKKVKSKEILLICYSKIDLTYYECYYLFGLNTMTREDFLNANILNRFHKGKISKIEENGCISPMKLEA